jgi:hypothetical protein
MQEQYCIVFDSLVMKVGADDVVGVKDFGVGVRKLRSAMAHEISGGIPATPFCFPLLKYIPTQQQHTRLCSRILTKTRDIYLPLMWVIS